MPLQFTDEGIARLTRAVREVTPRKRRRWLADIAQRFEPSQNAQRIRKHRARTKAGRATLSVECDLVAVEELLLANDLLTEANRDNRVAVAQGVSRLLDLLATLEMRFAASKVDGVASE